MKEVVTPVIVALDCDDIDRALWLAQNLSPPLCRLKVGKELFTRAGPALVEQLQGMDFEVFLDLKYHDIPNTVAGALRAAADLGVWMVNVHAGGGRRMLEQAREALGDGPGRPLLVAVTVLTSLTAPDLQELGIAESPSERVARLAALAADCGLDGVVCSPHEAALLRRQRGERFLLVTPGIRLEDTADDQRRVMTPAEALAAGSDYLVIGRPITGESLPGAKLKEIHRSLTDEPE